MTSLCQAIQKVDSDSQAHNLYFISPSLYRTFALSLVVFAASRSIVLRVFSLSALSASVERTTNVRNRTQNKTSVQLSDCKSDKKANFAFHSSQIYVVDDGVLASEWSGAISEMPVNGYHNYVAKHESITEGLIVGGKDEDSGTWVCGINSSSEDTSK